MQNNYYLIVINFIWSSQCGYYGVREIRSSKTTIIICKYTSTIENTPDKTQTISEAFTDPVFSNTPVGDINIPDPMMLPTMTVMPFKRLILGLSSIPSSLQAGTTSAASSTPSSFRFTPILLFSHYSCFVAVVAIDDCSRWLSIYNTHPRILI